tara:strand:- start:2036 stop:4129 length:2094 start_codon:yes stop_codon:yes gene_type:complete
MQKNNLLIEIVTEELPPLSQKDLGEAFAKNIAQSILELKLIESLEYETFSSPRRIGVLVKQVLLSGDNEKRKIKLMPAKVGFREENKPSDALIKKLDSMGEGLSSIKNLELVEEKGQFNIYLEKSFDGKSLYVELPQIINNSLAHLPIKKLMSYQLNDGWTTVNFVRPIKNILAVFGDKLVDLECMGLKSVMHTYGHRFESKHDVLAIHDASLYEKVLLTEGRVIASFSKRKEKIKTDLNEAVKKINNKFRAITDDKLLEEVTSLVEMPNILIGEFENQYLEVPQECLILTMQSNQKYFPILNDQDELTNYFVIVSNINPKNSTNIIEGNEKVIRPRLADAEFFYKKDMAYTLKKYSENLRSITYHNKLGTQHDRALRVASIMKFISKKLNVKNVTNFENLALHAKADLLCLMVGEFPELQGVIGRYYALNEGHANDFADAIEDHYNPKFSGGKLPREQMGDMLAIADKIETLMSLFSIGEKPTGVKDPFALRRNAIGLIRILAEKNIPLELDELLKTFYPSSDLKSLNELTSFIQDRLINYLKDKGFTPQQVEAVAGEMPKTLDNILERANAVKLFSQLNQSEDLASANKRVVNILKKYNSNNIETIDPSLLIENEEKFLFKSLNETSKKIREFVKARDYDRALSILINLKEPIDLFFEKIMVNADDDAIKKNRHNLLIQLYKEMNCVANISKLST